MKFLQEILQLIMEKNEKCAFIFTSSVFISYRLNIVQAYLHSMHNIAVTFNLTPVLQKVEK